MEQSKKTTEAQRKASRKYLENNRDKINEQRRKYYQNKKENDPDFLEYKRQKAKEYYRNKKDVKIEAIDTIVETIQTVKDVCEKVDKHIDIDMSKKDLNIQIKF